MQWVSRLMQQMTNYVIIYFSSNYTEHLENALRHIIHHDLPKVDALMMYRFGNKSGWWNQTVWAPIAMDNFTFIQRNGTPKDILARQEFPKFFLSMHIEKDPATPHRYVIKPYHIQIPATTVMTMDWLIYANEITSVEELLAIEQSFS